MPDIPQAPADGEPSEGTRWDAFVISRKFVHEASSSTPERPTWRVSIPKGTMFGSKTVGEGDFASASFLVRGKQMRGLESDSETALVRMPANHECYVSVGTRETDGSLSFEPRIVRFGEIARAIRPETDAWRGARVLVVASEHSSVRADCARVSIADNGPSNGLPCRPAEPPESRNPC